jgi:hypothetical protein
MHLNINDDKEFQEPSPTVLRRELRSVYKGEFAILSCGEERFIQLYHNDDDTDDDTFEFEYRDGAHDKHFGADRTRVTLDDLIEC